VCAQEREREREIEKEKLNRAFVYVRRFERRREGRRDCVETPRLSFKKKTQKMKIG